MQHWYLSLCMGGVWSAGWTESDQKTLRPPIQSDKYQCHIDTIQQFSPDDGHMDAKNMQRREIHKYNKKNCALSWTYLQDYTGMRGQRNIKKCQNKLVSSQAQHRSY